MDLYRKDGTVKNSCNTWRHKGPPVDARGRPKKEHPTIRATRITENQARCQAALARLGPLPQGFRVRFYSPEEC